MSLLDFHFLIFPPPCIWTCHVLFSTLLVYLGLLILLFHPTPLFGPIFYEIYIEYPPYSFIWHYLFNWHLRVDITPLQKRGPIKKVMACLLRDRSAQIRPSPNQLPHFMECCFLSFSSSPLNI